MTSSQPMASDPAEWSRASVGPEDGHESLDDILHQVAMDELRAMTGQVPQKRVVRTAVHIALVGIDRAAKAGVLPGQSDATFNEAQARLLAEIIDAPNSKLYAQCVDIVFGHGIEQGKTQTDLAAEHDQTKSNVSKICVGICERYKVPPSRAMKSLDARESYRKRQLGRRAKPTREPWPLAALLRDSMGGGLFAAAA